ncbi:MAG: cytidine deaminase [Sedimentisphaerales bacterium]|jgi:cytidine deaminase
MCGFLVKLANKCEVNFTDQKRGEKFYSSLRELVGILFAVVLGIGFSGLEKWQGIYDRSILIIAYIAVLLSWWGYHWGTIRGPQETNILNYVIDCLLVVVYWYMINVRSPITYVLLGYVAMFFLYWAWESVRDCKQNMEPDDKSKIARAKAVNRLFFFLVLVLLASRTLVSMRDGIYVLLLLISIFVYRILIHMIYKDNVITLHKSATDSDIPEEELIALAKDAASHARAPLSGYVVGAVILASSGKKYSGCNIEFDNYSNTIHAEEAAISGFVGAGEKEAIVIIVYTSGDKASFPCGMCRQSLFEIGGPKLRVIACTDTSRDKKTIDELLPNGFRL